MTNGQNVLRLVSAAVIQVHNPVCVCRTRKDSKQISNTVLEVARKSNGTLVLFLNGKLDRVDIPEQRLVLGKRSNVLRCWREPFVSLVMRSPSPP